jgi:hypothetical protein
MIFINHGVNALIANSLFVISDFEAIIDTDLIFNLQSGTLSIVTFIAFLTLTCKALHIVVYHSIHFARCFNG